MKPDSDSPREDASTLDTLLAEARADSTPFEGGRVRNQVLNTLSARPSTRNSPFGLAVCATVCLLLLVTLVTSRWIPQQTQESHHDSDDPAPISIDWVHGTSPEHVTPAVRLAMTEPYREQQESLRQDVAYTLEFLNRALPL